MPILQLLPRLSLKKHTALLPFIWLLCLSNVAMADETTTKDSSVQTIIKLGFIKAGSWHINQGKLNYSLKKHNNRRNILYAFVVQSKIKYIGKTTRTFKRRMNEYKNPGPTQSTNISNHDKITKLLEQKNPVNIYVFADKGAFKYKGFNINLAAGLEDTLIATLSPPWNKRK